MGLRILIDAKGKSWNVWEVPPRFSQQRSDVARREANRGHEPERRHLPERRVTKAPPEWIHGWICFAGGEEKRRLCPMPKEWESATDVELEHYLHEAAPVVPKTLSKALDASPEG
jgi:hypothetical protein